MAGFIYVLSNTAYDGRIKIGKTGYDPVRRASELYDTSAPEPFVIEYYAFVEDHDYVERIVHEKLATKRPNPAREFFFVTVEEAIERIRQLAPKIMYETVNGSSLPVKTAFENSKEFKRSLLRNTQHLRGEGDSE